MKKVKKIFLKKQFNLTPFIKMGLAKLDPKGLGNKAKLGCKDYKHYGEGK